MAVPLPREAISPVNSMPPNWCYAFLVKGSNDSAPVYETSETHRRCPQYGSGDEDFGPRLLLSADTLIQFTAAAGAPVGTATLSFRAWDESAGTVGDSLAIHGTAFSKDSNVVTAAVGDSPPTLNDTNPTLPAIKSSAKPGTGALISSLLGTALVDSPKSLRGIAVVGVDDSNGTWQYSLGSNAWIDFGAVSGTSAVLLDDTDRVRFVPETGFAVTVAGLQYKAWDRTAGQTGDRGVDTTGPLNSFSTFVETASILVTN
jgi:hypothetical protein